MSGLLAGIQGGVKLKTSGLPPAGPKITPPPKSVPGEVAAVSRAPHAPISSLFHGVNDSRKDVGVVASKKMKQLQWEKVGKAQLAKTVWSTNETKEDELVDKMKAVDVWSEMENEFKAREIIHDAFSEAFSGNSGQH